MDTIYMVGNAHLDPVWLWQWQEGMQEVHATFRSALDRMKEFPEFVFTCSSAAYYEWVEKTDPAMFCEIAERVREGRWVPVGGWWVQPDCNAPCGESFVRQGLYGQRYFEEKFGVTAKTGYNVDSFGHNGMLPQILKGCGMGRYVFMRPGCHEKGLPRDTFLWEGEDGTRVTAFRIPYSYCMWMPELDAHVGRCAEEMARRAGSIACFYGVGNHGGGPTKENLISIRRMNESGALPPLRMASPDDFFDDVEAAGARLPVVRGELLHHASGCYAAHSEVKRLNRQAENRLLAAERLSAAAAVLTGKAYPREAFQAAWKRVLFNQFHDILAGTSIAPAYDDAREGYGFALQLAAEALNSAVQAISWNIDIPQEEGVRPVVVVNPGGFDGKFPVELESPALPDDTVLLDETGRSLPFQRVRSRATAPGRCRVAFVAELPALGYRTFRFAPGATAPVETGLSYGEYFLENEYFRAEFSPETGALCSLVCKDGGVELIAGEGALPVYLQDEGDTWSHAVRRFDRRAGEVRCTGVRLLESGPVKAVLRVTAVCGDSRITQDYTAYAGVDRLLVHTAVDWREKRKLLKLRFPLRLWQRNDCYEIPYGWTQREPDGEEYPVQSWMDATGMQEQSDPLCGIAIANDGKSSCSAGAEWMELTVARSPVYAHHIPVELDEEEEYEYTDQGMQRFTYALCPYRGDMTHRHAYQAAEALNMPPVALFESYHAGPLPQSGGFLELIGEGQVRLGALKQAEDGGDWILRFAETAGRPAEITLRLPALGRERAISFRPLEIKTLRIPHGGEEPMVETSLLENREEARSE
jgi:alpha-mannosidase